MPTGNEQFLLDVSKFVEGTQREIHLLKKKTALTLFTKIVKRTPVDKGIARANWLPSNGVPVYNYDTKKRDKTGLKTIAEIEQVLNQSKLGEPVFLTNSVPYILRLEYGQYNYNPNIKPAPKVTSEGYSTQAPQGMVRLSFLEVSSDLRG